MKRGGCMAVALAWGLARSQTVTLAWDASPSPAVASYRVYWGTNSRAISSSPTPAWR